MFERKKLIYIAGPLTTGGDEFMNVRRAIDVAEELWDLGFVSYIPHFSAFWVFALPRAGMHDHERWLQFDFNIILRCDAVLRIPGDSKGADAEVTFAIENYIPVAFSIEEVASFWRTQGGDYVKNEEVEP